MSFPQDQTPVATQFGSVATAHLVSMPASVTAGDLLIIIIEVRGTQTLTTPGGWTVEWTDSGGAACYVRDADGTEGGTTVDVVSSVADVGAAQCLQITSKSWFGTLATGVESGTLATGSSDSPDPASVTPSWGALDTLFIAATGYTDDDATVSAYPTDHDDNQTSTVSGGGTNNGAAVATASRELNNTVDDPGTFTLSETEGWKANTLAIRPAPATYAPALFAHAQRRSTLLRM